MQKGKNMMKTAVRIFALILAAALPLAACSRAPVPPIPEETDAETTGAPDVTAAPDTTAIPETAAPETKATETTNVPVTTPAVTSAPETTAPVTTVPTTTPAVTIAPDEEELLQKELQDELKKLLYKGDDGYMHVVGSENIRIPATGVYLTFDDVLTGSYFASEELKMTAPNPGVPSYEGTDSPHSYYFEDDRLCVSYNNGETVFRLPDSLNTDVTGTAVKACYLSEDVSWFRTRVFITVWNKGETVTVSSTKWEYPTHTPLKFCYLSDTIGIGLSIDFPLLGTDNIVTSITEDAGASFAEFSSKNYAYAPQDGVVRIRTADERSYGRHSNNAVRFGDRVYFTGTYLQRGRVYIEQLIEEKGLPLTVMDIRLPDEEELLSGLYGYEYVKDCLLPYFEGEIGVVAYLIGDHRDQNSVKEYYRYYLSLDAGDHWIPYDPGIPENERTTVELTYTEMWKPTR